MVCVGGSVAVSSVLAGAPVFTAEAVRYGVACLMLVVLARVEQAAELAARDGMAVAVRYRRDRPGGVQPRAGRGVQARRTRRPRRGRSLRSSLLAVLGPLLEGPPGSRPRTSLVAAALVVTCGAGLVQGLADFSAVRMELFGFHALIGVEPATTVALSRGRAWAF